MRDNGQLLQQAHQLGINRFDYRSRTTLARAIQKELGHKPCFATDERDGCMEPCPWRKQCNALIAAWLR